MNFFHLPSRFLCCLREKCFCELVEVGKGCCYPCWRRCQSLRIVEPITYSHPSALTVFRGNMHIYSLHNLCSRRHLNCCEESIWFLLFCCWCITFFNFILPAAITLEQYDISKRFKTALRKKSPGTMLNVLDHFNVASSCVWYWFLFGTSKRHFHSV